MLCTSRQFSKYNCDLQNILNIYLIHHSRQVLTCLACLGSHDLDRAWSLSSISRSLTASCLRFSSMAISSQGSVCCCPAEFGLDNEMGFFFICPFYMTSQKKKKPKFDFLTPLCISCMTQICLLSFLIWFYCIKMWPDLAIDFRTYFKFFVFALSVSNFFLPLFPFFLFILEFSLLASLYFQLQLGTVGIKLRYWFFLYSIGPADNRS